MELQGILKQFNLAEKGGKDFFEKRAGFLYYVYRFVGKT
jgi:hypothetical protein